MEDQVPVLRQRLTELRDDALDFISRVESALPRLSESSVSGSYLGARETPDIWKHLRPEGITQADELRERVRRLFAQIVTVAQHSILLDESDFRKVSHNAKRMAAALRFRRFGNGASTYTTTRVKS